MKFKEPPSKSIRFGENVSLPISLDKEILILGLILSVYLFNVLIRINGYHHPFNDDYVYFDFAFQIKEKGGIFRFWQNYFAGNFPGLWSSLYFFFITPFAERSADFFNYATYINLFFGILMILSIYICTKNLFGNIIAFITTFLISINPIILERSALLAPENMLVLFSILAVFFFLKGFEEAKYWVFGGIFSLLAFFSKPNGIFILAAFFLTILVILIIKWKSLGNRNLYLGICFLGFLLFLAFSNASNNIERLVFDPLTWTNTGRDLTEYSPDKYGSYSSILDFIRTDFWGFWKRIGLGILKEAHRYAVGFFVSIEWIYKGHYVGNLGYIIVPFYFFLLTKDKNFERKTFFIVFSAVAFLGNIPLASVDRGTARYSIAVTPLFYFHISYLFYNLVLRVREKRAISFKIIAIIFFVLTIVVNGIVYRDSFKKFSFFPDFEKEYQLTLDWLKENTKEGEVIVTESNSKLRFKWYIPGIQEIVAVSTHNGKDIPVVKMLDYFKSVKAKYIVIDGKAFSSYNEGDYRYFFRKQIIRKNSRLKVLNLPEEVEIVFQPHDPPERIIILKIKE